VSKIVSVQILRGVAATLVAGFHLYAGALSEGTDPGFFRVFSGGAIGVDIFFVISGFIILYVSQNRPDMTRYDFVRSRFWRIFPPYWAILSLYIFAAIALAVILGDSTGIPELSSVFVSYLLIPYPDHIIILAWTLSLEILFYIVFAIFYYWGGASKLLAVMILWVAATQFFVFFVVEKPTWLLFPLHTAVLEFLFGILMAMYFCSRKGKKLPFHLPAFLIGLISVLIYLVNGGLQIGPFGREIGAGIPSALLVYGTLGFSLKKMKILETWGESSYTLYLLHILYFSITGKAIEITTGFNLYGSQIGMLGMLVSVVLISYGSTIYLERPYQKWYRRF
jgi:exopolysaccharide production protein ExoZ